MIAAALGQSMRGQIHSISSLTQNFQHSNVFRSPFQCDNWEDCGSYYKLLVNVRYLQDAAINIDYQKHVVILEVSIASPQFAKIVNNVKTCIVPPFDEELGDSNIIYHVDGENITLKLYKTDYKVDMRPPKKVCRSCTIQ